MSRPPIRVLLVDDDPEAHLLVRNYLERIEGTEYILDSVFDIESTLSRLRDPAYEYDVILLDHYLGEDKGTEILRDLKFAPLLPPVIVLTGQNDKSLDNEAMSLGASDFLVKSQVNSDLLDRSIRYALEHRRHERQIVLKQRELASRLIEDEINDPLSTIRSRALSIQTLAQKDPRIDPRIRESAADIIEMARKMTELKSGLRRKFRLQERNLYDDPGNSQTL